MFSMYGTEMFSGGVVDNANDMSPFLCGGKLANLNGNAGHNGDNGTYHQTQELSSYTYLS